ncbi:ionotropic receptor 93a-like isoform X2 [Portunus trituberculatus]|uniref:ionotropic receptor 93a-like isoform X2 n=1 Tax=Portunus trituberculatus TaxID=210409 RepID=UPI001E1CDC0D|nr:ionotropic receptor 93a-like isoform X2 [Portunus trituberculatus]
MYDFTVPFQYEMACFMARTELPLPRWQALAFPFQNWTWLAIFCGIIASGPALWLVANLSNVCGEELSSFRWLSFSWYYAFGLHFCESQHFLPHMPSTRIFVVFLWMYCMILTIVYSGNLTAFMLVRRAPASIQTVEDLYHSGLEVAALGELVFMSSIVTATDPYLRGLSKVFRVYASEYEVFPIVLAGKAVFLESRSFGEFHIATRFTHGSESSMRFMKECFAPYPIAMALQKHSPLKRKFDTVIGRVVESGLLHHFFQESVRLTATMKVMMSVVQYTDRIS